jgi:aspartate dehydrogenase
MSGAGFRPLRIAIVGWGAIARRVAGLLTARNDNIVLAGIATRRAPATRHELPDGVRWLPSPEALRDLAPDIVIEAAGRAAVEPWGLASLRYAGAFAICSTSAFTDDALLQRLVGEAERNGSQILVPSGALGGIDALAAAGCLALDRVTHRIIKPPVAWRGTAAEQLVDLGALKAPNVFFSGRAREVAARFPANANVAVISALAGLGLDRTEVELVADPDVSQNCHQLSVRGEFGALDVIVANRPLAENPKSSELAALSLVRLIEGRSRAFSL